jgi:hypothetical protein
MDCKCGAKAYAEHLKKVENGYPGHTFKGTNGIFGNKGSK